MSLPRSLALIALNAVCRLADKALCAWPNRTDEPICRDCKSSRCAKEC